MKKYQVFSVLITALCMWLMWYFWIIPINLTSGMFFIWIFLSLVVFAASWGAGSMLSNKRNYTSEIPKGVKIPSIVAAVFLVLYFICSFFSSTVTNAKAYSKMITVENREFTEDFKEMLPAQIPTLDKDSAVILGKRKLGEIVTLVSQFNAANTYTQINYKGKNTRVTPLEYADFAKWFTNNAEGIPYYIRVDMTTQAVTLHELAEPMKYSTSERFGRNVKRYVRNCYPTEILDEPLFEINDEDHPYWVVPVVQYTIVFNGGKTVKGIVLVDAVTGAQQYYAIGDIPQWVDNVYNSDMLEYHADNWGQFKDGWFNSWLGQKEAVVTTKGHGYLAIDDDIWFYTGVTSKASDESNIGFILINKRTEESKFYAVNGAEEYSAMGNAEGKVQEKEYTATFPLVINVADTPTYFCALKDKAGLVKMYAYSSVEHYQIIGVGEDIVAAQRNYIQQLNSMGASIITSGATAGGKIESIMSAVVDGNTQYYITLVGNTTVFVVSIKACEFAPVLDVGHTIEINYFVGSEDTAQAIPLKIVNYILLQ